MLRMLDAGHNCVAFVSWYLEMQRFVVGMACLSVALEFASFPEHPHGLEALRKRLPLLGQQKIAWLLVGAWRQPSSHGFSVHYVGRVTQKSVAINPTLPQVVLKRLDLGAGDLV